MEFEACDYRSLEEIPLFYYKDLWYRRNSPFLPLSRKDHLGH